ncbi:unnamed protein product [Microthlaspi erraticum]|uniref:Uncharacterized protein n=1 Tax=Microthlaspi erraticum TaxID=1685480 RepID=A0A6D2I795_9BRAS|nr:unnamed protein product [Microthlaspi erraticum]
MTRINLESSTQGVMKAYFWVIQAIVQLQSLQSSVQDDYGVGQCCFDDRSIAAMGDSPIFHEPEVSEAETEAEEVREEEEKVHEEVSDTAPDVGLPLTQVHRNHSSNDLIGDITEPRRTRGIKMNYKQMVSMAIINLSALSLP